MSAILRIDSSARTTGSVTRELSALLAADLAGSDAQVTVRDLAISPPPFVDELWVHANFTDPDARSEAQNEILSGSEALVRELEAADQIVIGVPVYNFGVPASLKAWIDQVARAKRTFRYTSEGPVGLVTGKTVWLVVASGGTELGSEIDFATPYLKHVLGFIGITDVRIIDATRWGSRDEAERRSIREHAAPSKAAA